MVRSITALSDRLLGLVAPKATAKATVCSWVFCYCHGANAVYQKCCNSDDNVYSCTQCNHNVVGAC